MVDICSSTQNYFGGCELDLLRTFPFKTDCPSHNHDP